MKPAQISVLVAGVLIAAAILFSRSDASPQKNNPSVNNVSVSGEKQIVEIEARGGYSPRLSQAKADTPTVIRMKTSGTFDCSSALVIPALGYRTNLPAQGMTDIEIPPQKSGAQLQGLCAMSMYSFVVNFN